jgi:sugar lactone lactonase YvrE
MAVVQATPRWKFLRYVLTVASLILAACANPVSNSTSSTLKIQSYAGTGAAGYSGDNGNAASAQFHLPIFVDFDSSQNLFIADWANNAIRRIDPSGKITTVAGTGVSGYSGDGGPAAEAEMSTPNTVIVDKYGSIYISDWGNNVVRKVNPKGIISTYAGNGLQGYSGDGGSALSAELDGPTGIAIDNSGNLYISDSNSNVIRKVNSSGNISTFAGTGGVGRYSGDGGPALSAKFNSPSSLAFDLSGNLLVSDYNNGVIRKIDATGTVTTIVGNGTPGFLGDGGPATSSELNSPGEVTVDFLGNLFVADTGNNRIRKINTSGIISTIAGNGNQGFSGNNGPATAAQLNNPTGVVSDSSGNLYLADELNNCIRKIVLNTAGQQDQTSTTSSTQFGSTSGAGGTNQNAQQ